MLCKADLFNEESICIFTDSSFKRYKYAPHGSAIGATAPAYCVYHIDNCIEQGFHILHNSTSQQGELYAMLLGVMASYKYRNFKHIRLFSDNQNAVLAIRERIFKWVEENELYPTLGDFGRISNQPYIMDIIYTIISNNIFIELYHIKGHVDIRSSESVKISKDLFKRSNPFVGDSVGTDLIYQLAFGNNRVDEYSTMMLKTTIHNAEYDTRGMTNAVTIGYTPFDMDNYSMLVNRGGKDLRKEMDKYNE